MTATGADSTTPGSRRARALDPRDRHRSGVRVPLERPPSAEGARPAGDGSRLGRPGAAGRAVPVRRRDARRAARSTTSPATCASFLREVPDAPPPLAAAMRMSDNQGRRAPRSARPPRPACGTWRTGSSSARRRRAALGVLRDAVEARRRQLGRPARRGDGHRRPRPTATRPAARRRSSELARAQRGWPARDVLERDSVGRDPARERLGQDLGADAAAAPRRARARPARRRRAPAPAAAPRARARRPHPHRHGVARLARGGARARARGAGRGRVRRRAVGRAGAAGLPARLARAARRRCSTGRARRGARRR